MSETDADNAQDQGATQDPGPSGPAGDYDGGNIGNDVAMSDARGNPDAPGGTPEGVGGYHDAQDAMGGFVGDASNGMIGDIGRVGRDILGPVGYDIAHAVVGGITGFFGGGPVGMAVSGAMNMGRDAVTQGLGAVSNLGGPIGAIAGAAHGYMTSDRFDGVSVGWGHEANRATEGASPNAGATGSFGQEGAPTSQAFQAVSSPNTDLQAEITRLLAETRSMSEELKSLKDRPLLSPDWAVQATQTHAGTLSGYPGTLSDRYTTPPGTFPQPSQATRRPLMDYTPTGQLRPAPAYQGMWTDVLAGGAR